jgi:predicted amino acid-binding ACT domain protein
MATPKKLKAMALSLNKSGALKEKIDLKQKSADLEEEFMSAVEECEDNKTLKKVPKDVIKFYEKLAEAIAEAEKEADAGDSKEEADELEGKAAAESELEEAEDIDDLKAIVKEHELDVKIKKSSKFKATKKLVAAEIEEMEDAEAEEPEPGNDNEQTGKEAAEASLEEAEDIDDLKAIVKEHELDVKIKKASKFKATKKLVAAEIDEMEDAEGGSENDEPEGKAAAEASLEEAEDIDDLKAIVKEHELDVKIKKSSKFKATKKLVADEIEEMEDAEAEEKDEGDKKDKPSFKRGKDGYTREQSVCDVLLKGKAVLRKDLGKLANDVYVKNDGSDNVKQSNTIAGRALRYLEGINVIEEKKGKITLTTE